MAIFTFRADGTSWAVSEPAVWDGLVSRPSARLISSLALIELETLYTRAGVQETRKGIIVNVSAVELSLVILLLLIPAVLTAAHYRIAGWLLLAFLGGPLGIFAFISATIAAHRRAPIGRHFLIGLLAGPIGNLITAAITPHRASTSRPSDPASS